MVRTIVFLLLSLIALGALATPGVAAVGLLLLLFVFGAGTWLIALAVTTRGRPAEAVILGRHRFLGPGGPDDPFADVPYDEDLDREPLDSRRRSGEEDGVNVQVPRVFDDTDSRTLWPPGSR
jgi:hypothetical protein